jgi:hypothetical protein
MQGLLVFPLLHEGPIEQSKELAIVLDDWIMIEKRGQEGLVKGTRNRYHTRRLLCGESCGYEYSVRGSLLCQAKRAFLLKASTLSIADLLAPVFRESEGD